MFTAAQFVIAQMGNHPKGLSTLEWISKLTNVCTMEWYTGMRKIIIKHNNIEKSQKGTIEQMSDTKENTLYDSIYRNFKQVALIDSGRNQYPWRPEENS